MVHSSQLEQLLTTVVNGGYCVGCGACASVSGSPIQMKLDQYGKFQATIDSSDSSNNSEMSISLLSVCPFSGENPNEDQIGRELFAKNCEYDDQIGYYQANYAGYVYESDYRTRGSSGGMGTWIVVNLLLRDLVDYVIHIQPRQPSDQDSRLFHYQISTTIEQVKNGAKSRYYPIELSEVMQQVREQPGRYVIVGIPCFLKAVRLLMLQDAILAERIKFCVGLVCGHLKSTQFAQMFAWQCGIEPGNILKFDFRKKIPGKGANRYGIEVVGRKDGQIVTVSKPISELYGADWGLGFFKYKACDYCDDVVAEVADVSVGDAWLPQYVKDSQGTNVIVVRNPQIGELLEQGINEGRLKLDPITADEVARSQKSGFVHRRDGLAYRLSMAEHQGIWHPSKRVHPQVDFLNPWLTNAWKSAFYSLRKAISPFRKRLKSLIFPYLLRK